MAKGKHTTTALFDVLNRPGRTPASSPATITRAPSRLVNSNPQRPPAPEAPASLPPSFTAPAGEAEPAVKVDSDRHLIFMRMSYATAIVAGFAVLVVVGLAYLLGRGHTSKVASSSTEDLRKGPPTASVMNVSPAGTAAGPTAGAQAAGAKESAGGVATGAKAVPEPTNVKRIIGQNYVILQAYPDEQNAREALSAVLAAGIPATIERGPANYAPMTWYSVISTQGFARTKSPEYESFIKSIEAIKYAEKSKSKRFDPQPYRWR